MFSMLYLMFADYHGTLFPCYQISLIQVANITNEIGELVLLGLGVD